MNVFALKGMRVLSCIAIWLLGLREWLNDQTGVLRRRLDAAERIIEGLPRR